MNKKIFSMAMTTTLLITSTLSSWPQSIYAQDSFSEIQAEENLSEQTTENETQNDLNDSTTNLEEEQIEQDFTTVDDDLNREEYQLNTSNTDSSNIVYVSTSGNDDNNGGIDSPFLTLKKAAEKVVDQGTIILQSDLTLDQSVRIYNKSITIKGNGHCVKRGNIERVSDVARQEYNPALFEINSSNNQGDDVLTFENIILDDDGVAAGEVFKQQSTDQTDSNENKVQDAMIASYINNKIVFKQGTILQNYGGMSAVRLTSEANLIMEEGSKICDTRPIERGHAASGQNGQAGAIWIQGGRLDMQVGSSIQDIIGRAIYVDGGIANVGGTISNIKGRTKMWQGASGVAIHNRNEGIATFSGHITNITANGSGGDNVVAIRNENARFESTAESIIDNVQNIPVLYSQFSNDCIVGGLVENCSFHYLFRSFMSHMTLRKQR